MYEYKLEKKFIFSDKGQRAFLKIRDHIQKCIEISGAISMGNAMSPPEGSGAGDTWKMMACVDRVMELGEIREIPQNNPAGQHRIFVKVE